MSGSHFLTIIFVAGNVTVKRESPHVSDEEDSVESDGNEELSDALSWAREKTLKESLDLLSKLINEVRAEIQMTFSHWKHL